MRPPKWIKPAYVEIFCGFILFLFTFIEFNNRNALFVSENGNYHKLNT